MQNENRHPHWRVSVETSGEQIVAIETEMLAGREISEADEDAIRTAAHHLLAFIGDAQPETSARCKAFEEAAAIAEEFHFMKDIEWWLNSTKKEISAETCLLLAAAIRQRAEEEGR